MNCYGRRFASSLWSIRAHAHLIGEDTKDGLTWNETGFPDETGSSATPFRKEAVAVCLPTKKRGIIVQFVFLLFVSWINGIGAQDFAIVRLKYHGGGDWYGNPSSLPNLIAVIRERTWIDIQPAEVLVEIMDEKFFSYPVVYMTGHGNVKFSEEEVERLRAYLLSGGFLFADDNYGMDQSFRRELKKVFPNKELVDLPFDHEIFHCFYQFSSGIPKIHEHEGGPGHGLALFHDRRMIVFYSYNTDLGDGWEDITVHNDPPEKHEEALRMGINVITYLLTH